MNICIQNGYLVAKQASNYADKASRNRTDQSCLYPRDTQLRRHRSPEDIRSFFACILQSDSQIVMLMLLDFPPSHPFAYTITLAVARYCLHDSGLYLIQKEMLNACNATLEDDAMLITLIQALVIQYRMPARDVIIGRTVAAASAARSDAARSAFVAVALHLGVVSEPAYAVVDSGSC